MEQAINVTLKYHNIIRDATGKRSEVLTFPRMTRLRQVLIEICDRYGPRLRQLLLTEEAELSPYARIFLDSKAIHEADLDTEISDGAELLLFPAIAGGAGGKDYVIVGSSAAGLSALEAIRQREGRARITVISREAEPPYSRIFTPDYVAGKVTVEDMLVRPHEFYEQMEATILQGEDKTVLKVEPRQKSIHLADGQTLTYNKLLIASGASPILPNIPGVNLDGVSTMWTLADARKVARWVEKATSAVVVGGGLVGLKTAEALLSRGLRVTVVVSSGQVLSQMLDREPARIVEKRMEELGVRILTRRDVIKICGPGRVESVVLNDGQRLPCQLVVMGKGVKPNIDFVQGTDIKVRRGIIVDERCQTSVPDIYAAGDATEAYDVAYREYRVNAMWLNATQQGQTAGANMSGESLVKSGTTALNIGSFFKVPVASLGISRPQGDGYIEHIWVNTSQRYRKIVTQDNYIVGVQLVGDVSDAGIFHHLIQERRMLDGMATYLPSRKLTYSHTLAKLPLIGK
ncbi:MAG: FAD-dependent oxidoreductase [Chloroflexi bacterium]|nr:FAD-dependent oxidoreductase [Chloroflexota bacterium]MCL5074418.1 FAD-dependent oxidoreductase [Chloroflexota bacterium]